MRRNVGRQWLMVLCALALSCAALPAFAQTAPTTTPATASTTATASPCDQYPGLTAKMAGCIRDGIDSGAQTFYDQIYPYVQGAIGAAMTLAVIVYGILLAFGAVEKVGRDTYIMMMKLAAVVVFCSSSQWITDTVTGAMDGAATAVVSYAPSSGTMDSAGTDASQSVCLQTMESQPDTDSSGPLISPWLAVDCLVDTAIGIHVTSATTGSTSENDSKTWFNKNLDADGNEGLSRSLLYLFFGCMESSILGLIIAIIGFIFIYGLIMLIIRCFFIYIAGYMGVTFLAIISPFIIPLILFKETKQYFDKWARMFISFALQPVVMLVFLVFSICAVDMAVYSGTYSIYYAIAGTQSQQANFSLNKYMTDNKIINQASKNMLEVKADSPLAVPKGDRDTGGTMNKLLFANCTPAAIAKDPTLKEKCAFQYPIGLIRTSIDWGVMESTRQPPVDNIDSTNPGKAETQVVLSSIFFCLMVVMVLNGLLAMVPMIVGDLLGDLNQSPILGRDFAGGGGSKGSIVGSLTKAVGNPLSKFGGLIGKP